MTPTAESERSRYFSLKSEKVYGVEIVPEAIEDAKRNAELNGIHNAEFEVGEAEVVIQTGTNKASKRTSSS